MKLAIIFSFTKLSSKLTKLFTGCYAYHVAWVDEKAGLMYDMNLIRRRRVWPNGYQNVSLYDHPEVTRDYLENKLNTDENTYGWIDYTLFTMRPVYHFFGKSTRNAKGVICSEMVNNDIWECGGTTPWHPDGPPPSPCDFYRWKLGL